MSKASASPSPLRVLREKTGLSQRELARLIDERQSNVSFWERTGILPRSDKLAPIAQALGVAVEELLGQSKPRRVAAPGGKVRTIFEQVQKLPRRQQEQILKVISALLVQQQTETRKAG